MEAGSSSPAPGERPGRPEQRSVSAEPPPGPRPPRPALAAARGARSLGRAQSRAPPQRSTLLLRLQQQQAIAWQTSDPAGPSGGSFLSAGPSSSVSPAAAPQHCPDAPEGGGTPKRAEKKPPKPGRYVCSYCGRPCAKPSVLQKHIRSHTGERPYPCPPCGFSFKTKSNLYKHRKSHAHRTKAGLAPGRDDPGSSGPEGGGAGEEPEEPTEGESTESEEETGQRGRSSSTGASARRPGGSTEEAEGPGESQRQEDSQVVKQRLAMRLSERKRGPRASPDDRPSSLSASSSSSLGPGSKGSTESGYFSGSGSTETSQVSPPSTSAKSYAEIILGKYGRMGGQQRHAHLHHQQQQQPHSSSGTDDKSLPAYSLPKTQVIEHITKLITINEAVVDTSEIDSVKPRRSSLSRKSSMESPKFCAAKDPHASQDPCKGEVPGPSYVGRLRAPGQDQACLPLLRSHSMPSSCQAEPACGSGGGGTGPPGTFRLSHSFDEQQALVTEMRVGHAQRMLRRQPAIEVPPCGEGLAEGARPPPASHGAAAQHPDPAVFRCEACGACCEEREGYEAHRGACPSKRVVGGTAGGGAACGTRREDRPQIMHYKFRALAMAVRKRRKEESLEEDPPSPGPTAAPSTSAAGTTGGPGRPEHTHAVSGAPSQSETHQQRPRDRKGVSVIQHTSSFEKQESVSMGGQEPEHRTGQPEPKPSPSSSRLTRQPNIQVPEILVTAEQDADMPSVCSAGRAAPSKEVERVEEFQWPQRSHSLSQLPAEKLPPKKKRLRLTQMAQSSGESSFEAPSLPRSPSQESSASHASSLSAPCDDAGGAEPGPWASGGPGPRMLTVPLAPHQEQQAAREMRRSASEQTPASPARSQPVPDTRSKSFDLGSLSPPPAASAWRERRKCLLLKHAALGEPEPEEGRPPREESPTPGPSRPGAPPVRPLELAPALSLESVGKTLQLFRPQTLARPPAFLARDYFPQIVPRAYLHSQTGAPPAPIQIHPAQVHMAERLGIPLHRLPGLLPLRFSTGPGGPSQVLFRPAAPLLTVHAPGPSSAGSGPPTASLSPSLPHLPLVPVSHGRAGPVIMTCLAQLSPTVSLVVPVRLQTHVPGYASAMYTTLSQILASTPSLQQRQQWQPVCCSGAAVVVTRRLEQEKTQRSYLKVPSPDLESLLPPELAPGSRAGEGYGPLGGAGGSKRMLSPAASLELSTEAQRHQKRVKEEEEVTEKKVVEEEGREVEGTLAPEEKRSTPSGSKVEEEEEEPAGTERVRVGVGAKVEREEQPLPEDQGQEARPPREGGPGPPPAPDRTPPYPNLASSTAVNWCYLNYTKPSPSSQWGAGTSVYASWSVSDHNPNLPGLSTKVALSLLRSKQTHSQATYTVASASRPARPAVPTPGGQTPRVTEVHAAPPRAPPPRPEREERRGKKKGRGEEEGGSSSRRSESPRVRVFEGGYKSNEEYVYVRGRGRGRYVCGECGIRCKKPSMLRKHIRTHTDVRPYVCKHCNFAFKTKGNLTKHMKSKAHGKKCQTVGVTDSSLDDPEGEEAGGSEEHACRSEEQEEQEEHQFSDPEDFDEDEDEDDDDDDDDEEDDDEDEEEEEEESSSHDDPPSSCSSETRTSTGARSTGSRLSPGGTPDPEGPGGSPGLDLAPRRLWASRRAASPGSRRAVFSRRGWSASPRAFSPGGEGCSPSRSVSPRVELSSSARCLSPRTDPPSPGQHPSPERGPSPAGALSPLRPLTSSCYRASHAPPPALQLQYRPPGYLPWEGPGLRDLRQESSGAAGEEVPMSPEATPFPPTFRLSFGESYPGGAAPDQVFSHLPLHSQQARLPYLMIPIGGIQMVPARQRPHPTTASPSSPTSPGAEGRFQWWGGASGPPGLRTSSGGPWSGYQEAGTSGSGTPDPRAAFDCSTTETTDSKQYGSSRSPAPGPAPSPAPGPEAPQVRGLRARDQSLATPSHGPGAHVDPHAPGPPRGGPAGAGPGPAEGPGGPGAEGDPSRTAKIPP